ncbi:MAG: 6-bladed beta-propeller [Acidobacteriia bacterium]|nr:6-bladed beta-propeller [Terriglobia bacterium]
MYKHRIQQLAPAMLACYLGMTSACMAPPQETYREVQWPLPATTDAGTPSPWHYGEAVAVATTAQGTILVFHRGALPIMEFDVSGNFIRSLGGVSISGGKVTGVAPENRAPGGSGYTAVYGPAGCYSCGAHSIRVDPSGHIWIVDATAHAVYKTDSDGNVLLQLGEVGVSGTDESHFNLPTDVAFGTDGTIYVSDGYAGARIVKFSNEGRFLLDWGSRGIGPGEFGLPHNLVVDGEGQVYITDRDNQRIQVFDSNGKFLEEWEGVGGISTLYMTADQKIWAGGVLRSLDGTVAAMLPGDVGGHGTTVAADGSVFIAQLSGVVQKFEPVL